MEAVDFGAIDMSIATDTLLAAIVLLTLLIVAYGLGRQLLRALPADDEMELESPALALAAGLGVTALLLAGLALAGRLSWSLWILPAAAFAIIVLHYSRVRKFLQAPSRSSALAWFPIAMSLGAALGALAPVTEYDSLCYSLPIVRHLLEDNAWHFWPDQVRSVLPLSQSFLIAPIAISGSQALGLVSAMELAIAVALTGALARRCSSRLDTPWIASTLALGCPAVAFLAASAKDDLLAVVMTLAAAVSLLSKPGLGASSRVGLFAGLAVGAKLTSAPIAMALVAAVPFCCGRTHRVRDVAIAASFATAACGLWFIVNYARFGNPMPLLALGPWFTTPLLPTAVVSAWNDGFGTGRGVVDALQAPLRLALGGEAFGGRGNWINPAVFIGVGALFMPALGRKMRILAGIAALGYLGWFAGIQVSRLLLPAMVLLSVPAAEILARLRERTAVVRYAIAAGLLLSAASVCAVGLTQFARYVSDPSVFLQRETPHYRAITWMNRNLDPATHRVATSFAASAYLEIPWIAFDTTYQSSITTQELADPALLEQALRRERLTHVFGPPGAFEAIAGILEAEYDDPQSETGRGFFRRATVRRVVVYKLR